VTHHFDCIFSTEYAACTYNCRPLFERNLKLIKYAYQQTNGEFLIIGTGGVFSTEDAIKMIRSNNGRPLKPPSSTLLAEVKPSRCRVVFAKMIPSTDMDFDGLKALLPAITETFDGIILANTTRQRDGLYLINFKLRSNNGRPLKPPSSTLLAEVKPSRCRVV
jgi:dihydroorotate dehydrogenase